MKRSIPQVLCALFALHTLSLQPASAQSTCEPFRTRLNQATAAGNGEAAFGIYQEASRSATCQEAEKIQIGRTAASALSVAAAKPGLSDAARIKILERVEQISFAPWQSLAHFGDLLRTEGQRLSASNETASRADYTRAAKIYQLALNDIINEGYNPQAPDNAVIKTIYERAQQMALLASDHVPSPTTHRGTPGGHMAKSYRGFTPVATVVPVEYVYNSTRFTPKGEKAAAELAEVLAKLGDDANEITLVGHTDPIGGDEFNMQLSRSRAEALKAFLIRSGYKGRIITEGKGKRQPPHIDDEGQYTQKDLHQIMRRVELVR